MCTVRREHPLKTHFYGASRTDDALFGVAPLTHVMPVIVRFLDHASCTSMIPLDPTRHRRLLAVQPACRIAPICAWSTKQRLRPTCCSVYLAPMSIENAFQCHKITFALIDALHMCALLALTLSRSTHLREARHMCIQDIPTTNTRFLCVSRIMSCASQRARRPLSRRHRKPWRAAKMPAPERLLPHDAENGVKQQPGAAGLPSLLLLSAGCALRRVLLQYVKEEPGALRPLPQRPNHSRVHLSWRHARPEACKQSLLFSARAAGRANGGEASARACLSWPNCPGMSSSWSGMKSDAIALLLLTHKKWHKCQLAAKQGVRSVDSEGVSSCIRVRSQAMDISWCAKHAEECVLTG